MVHFKKRITDNSISFNLENTVIYGSNSVKPLKFTESHLVQTPYILVYQIDTQIQFKLHYLGNKKFEYETWKYFNYDDYPIKSNEKFPYILWDDSFSNPYFQIDFDLSKYNIVPKIKSNKRFIGRFYVLEIDKPEGFFLRHQHDNVFSYEKLFNAANQIKRIREIAKEKGSTVLLDSELFKPVTYKKTAIDFTGCKFVPENLKERKNYPVYQSELHEFLGDNLKLFDNGIFSLDLKYEPFKLGELCQYVDLEVFVNAKYTKKASTLINGDFHFDPAVYDVFKVVVLDGS